jgi:hypothetical protein
VAGLFFWEFLGRYTELPDEKHAQGMFFVLAALGSLSFASCPNRLSAICRTGGSFTEPNPP